MNKKTIISVSGYGATGSSAVVDFLKGFDFVEVLDDFEFQLHYLPDGISDLDYKLNDSCSRFYDSDIAIKRFLELCSLLEDWYRSAFNGHLREMAEEYIEELSPVSWNGYWAYDRLVTPKDLLAAVDEQNRRIYKRNFVVHQLNRVLRKLHLPQLDDQKPFSPYFHERRMNMSIKPDNFLSATRHFSEKLINTATKSDKPVVVVNQMLPPHDPGKYFKYFESEVKSIVTSRDPRDLWIHIKRLNQSHYLPHENVTDFIRWYKDSFLDNHNASSYGVLRICFEDMVYNEEETEREICSFLGFSRGNIGNSFDPRKSVVNTQLFHKFPEFGDDVLKIEASLPEYLYDFDKFPNVEPLVGIQQF